MRILDSHLHLWDPTLLDYGWLEGTLDARFAEEELRGNSVLGAGEAAAIFVQADCVPEQFLNEVRWVQSVASSTGVRAIVAGARLDQGAATAAHLAALAAEDLVVGVRHLLQSEQDDLAYSPAFVAGARALDDRGMTFDACVRAEQIPAVTRLAEAVPTLRMVLDHLGKPLVGSASDPMAPSESWLDHIAELAQHPQVYCKVSGLPAEAGGDWSAHQITPFLDAAATAFGPQRLMWGSDWPVSGTEAGGRTRWAHAVSSWAQQRAFDVDAILWRNGAEFYGI